VTSATGAPNPTVARGEAPLTVARAVKGPVATPLGHDRPVASMDNTGPVGLAENAPRSVPVPPSEPVARSKSRTQVRPQVKPLAAVEATPAGPGEPGTAPENAAVRLPIADRGEPVSGGRAPLADRPDSRPSRVAATSAPPRAEPVVQRTSVSDAGATAARATPGGLVWQQEPEPGGVADPRPTVTRGEAPFTVARAV